MTLPEPYYRSPDGAHVLYCADCLDILPLLEAGSVDAVVTDPPYNVGLVYAGDETGDLKPGYAEWLVPRFRATDRLTKLQAISCGIANLSLWFTIRKPVWILAWHKPAAMGRCAVGFNNWEPVIVYGKTPKQIVDVFKACIIPDEGLDGHPCPKPLDWGLWLVENLSKPAQTILDPFAGSCTTAVACIRTGRRSISIEKEEKYCAIGKRRIEEAIGVGTLFDPKVIEPDLFAAVA